MRIYLFCLIMALQSISIAFAQGLSTTTNADDCHLLDRYEIMSGSLDHDLHLTTKNVSMPDAVSFLENLDVPQKWTLRDKANKKSLLQKYHEYTNAEMPLAISKHPILKKIYTTPNNFFEYFNTDNQVFVAINPILYYQQIKESGSDKNVFINTRGAELKGYLGRKVSFYTQFTDNQERGPSFVRNFITDNYAVPGAGYIKNFKIDGTDYTLAKGYVSVQALKNHIDISLGHDQFFIGDGYRSLFLSDFGNNNLFVKMNTKFWKIHYQNLFMELYPTRRNAADALLPRKYMAMHHLSVAIKPWLQIGAFESVVFGRKDHFEFQYLNPVIFYRTIEQQNGSPDNAMLGFDAKILPIKHLQIYSQFLLDEFKFGELKSNKAWWANKYAFQLGAKYINVAGIAHLDVQVERNFIRPFMYSYRDSVADYSSYNQPLAHPNGANLIENIAIIRYQPLRNFNISVELINRAQGLDTSIFFSNGGNILKNNELRNGQNYGFVTTGGTLQTTNYINANATYQFRQNLYIDAGLLYRKATSSYAGFNTTSSNIYVGFRLNTNRRTYRF
jgi:hypothetical protein